jgi:hypothetical protein
MNLPYTFRQEVFMPPASNFLSRKGYAAITVIIFAGTLFLTTYLIFSTRIFQDPGLKPGVENAAIQTLRTVHNAQFDFWDKHKRFGSLQELFDAGFLKINLSRTPTSYGYVFTDSGISESTYCVHATRTSQSKAYRDFNLSEEGVIRANMVKRPALLLRNDGVPLSDSPLPK